MFTLRNIGGYPRFFDTPLRYDTYVALRKAVEETFSSFVNVKLVVRTADGSDQYLLKYWHYAVQNSNVLQPVAREFLAGQKPDKIDNRWVIPIDNNVIDGMIEQKALDDLAEEMRNYGFFNLKFITQVDNTSSQNNLESLQELQQEHEKSMQQVYEKKHPINLNRNLVSIPPEKLHMVNES